MGECVKCLYMKADLGHLSHDVTTQRINYVISDKQ